MSANPVQKAQKSMSAKVCMSQMTLSSYSLFQLSVPTVLKPRYLHLQVLLHLIVREKDPPFLDAPMPLKEHNSPAPILRRTGNKIIGAIAEMFTESPS